MMSSNSNWFLLALTAWALAAGGCMHPPVRWRHDVGERRFAPTGDPLLVLPVDDRRELRNEDPSLLNYLPLVPWTVETDRAFERVLRRPGTRRHSAPHPDMKFDAFHDLREAAAQQLGYARRFGPVFRSRDETGRWPGTKQRLHTLRLRLDKLAFRQAHLRYGLGPVAFAAFALGAPQRRIELHAAFGVELRRADGSLRWQAEVDETRVFYDGWYYPIQAEQQALTEISLVLAEALDRMQEACEPGAKKP